VAEGEARRRPEARVEAVRRALLRARARLRAYEERARVGPPSVALLARRQQHWEEVQALTATLHRLLRTRPDDAAPK
jgi:hypothetical protein